MNMWAREMSGTIHRMFHTIRKFLIYHKWYIQLQRAWHWDLAFIDDAYGIYCRYVIQRLGTLHKEGRLRTSRKCIWFSSLGTYGNKSTHFSEVVLFPWWWWNEGVAAFDLWFFWNYTHLVLITLIYQKFDKSYCHLFNNVHIVAECWTTWQRHRIHLFIIKYGIIKSIFPSI